MAVLILKTLLTERKDPHIDKGDRGTAPTTNTAATGEATNTGNGAVAQRPPEREMGEGSGGEEDTCLADAMGDKWPDALPGPSKGRSNLGLPTAFGDHWASATGSIGSRSRASIVRSANVDGSDRP